MGAMARLDEKITDFCIKHYPDDEATNERMHDEIADWLQDSVSKASLSPMAQDLIDEWETEECDYLESERDYDADCIVDEDAQLEEWYEHDNRD